MLLYINRKNGTNSLLLSPSISTGGGRGRE